MFPEYTDSVIFVGSVEYPIYLFTNSEDPTSTLTECKMDVSTDLISSELPIDTLVFSINLSYEDNEANDFNPEMVPSGTKVYYYYGNNPIGKFYVKRLTKTGKYAWTFECENYIGLLDSEPFYGMFCKADDAVNFEMAVKHILLTDGIRVFRPCESVSVADFFPSNLYVYYSNNAVTEVHFRYDGLYPLIHAGNQLTERIYFYGTYQSHFEDYQKGAYRCIFADISRNNASEKYNETVTLRFSFGGDDLVMPAGGEGLKLIQISPGEDVQIKISPGDSTHEGSISVNGFTTFLPAISVDTIGVLPLIGVMESRDYYKGFHTTSDVNITYFSHKINGKEITFVENTAKECIATQTVFPDGSVEYPPYDNTGDEKRWFKSIAYRAEKPGDENRPFSFPDSRDTEVVNALSFEEDTGVKLIEGVIPQTTKRDALHQLMFASGICIKQDANGDFSFSTLLSKTTNIPDTSIFDVGDINYDNSVSRLNVTAYEVVDTKYDSSKIETAFTNIDTNSAPSGVGIASLGDVPWKIYEGDSGGDGTYFTNGLTALYTGIITLRGLRRSILERHHTWEISNPYGKRALDVSGCKLVNPSNVDVVGEKLAAYYESFTRVNNEIVYSGERCGDKFDFTNPFGEKTAGYLSHMSLTAYGFIRASCEFVANFTIPPAVTGYRESICLTGSGIFALPENALLPIKIVLIGGGQGGASGYPGEDGASIEANGGSGMGGKGGKGGKAGKGGKIYSVTLRKSSSKAISYRFPYRCGAGGKGGIAGSGSTPGGNGGDTVFAEYSSQLGYSLENGLTAETSLYARPGEDGIVGGEGGSVERFPVQAGIYAFKYSYAENSHNGVAGATSDPLSIGERDVSSGAGGGGAAYNSNGGDATSAVLKNKKITNASGGAGANAGAPEVFFDEYGCGGNGGHGGGGGGASGTGNSSNYTFVKGKGGKGGQGSNGLDGIEGCILVFYNTKEST